MTRTRWQIIPVTLFVILVLAYCSILARAQSTEPSQNAIAAHSAKAKAKTDSPVASDDLDSTEIMDSHDPRFGVPAIPKGNVSLIGGTVTSVDPIRQRLTIQVFGNKKKMTFGYDERSHLFRDGKPASYKALQKGAHVYVDSMLVPGGNQLLARNVRVVTSLEPADARGQITQYRPRTGTLVIMDELSQRPIYLRVSNDTKITGNGADSRQDLVPGSLVTVRFASDYKKSDIAREITILATPGSSFTFAGSVTYLDMKDGVMAVHNQSDNKTYELHFDDGTVGDNVTVGSDVVVNAEFEGTQYKAKSVKLTSSNNSQAKSDSTM